MIVLFKCTCMISSLCILRWQCILGNVNDANSNYLGNQQQTDQKIVLIGLKTPSEFFLVPGGLRGLLKEIWFITFFFPCTETLSQKKWFLFREQQFFPVLGEFTECFFNAKSAITANKTARGSHSYSESLTLFPLPVVPKGVWLHGWSFSIQSGAWENYSYFLNGSEHQWGVGVLLGLLSALGLLAFK